MSQGALKACPESFVKNTWVPWENLFDFSEANISLVISKLAETYSKQAVVFALGEHPIYGEFVPSEMKRNFVMPGSRPVQVGSYATQEVPRQQQAPQHGNVPMPPPPMIESTEFPSEFASEFSDTGDSALYPDPNHIEDDAMNMQPPSPPKVRVSAKGLAEGIRREQKERLGK
jgi:hypothetical protein